MFWFQMCFFLLEADKVFKNIYFWGIVILWLHLVVSSRVTSLVLHLKYFLFLCVCLIPGSGGVFTLSAFCQTGQLHVPVLASSLHLKRRSVSNLALFNLFRITDLHSALSFLYAAHFKAKEAGDMSTLFDVGGILGKPLKFWVCF